MRVLMKYKFVALLLLTSTLVATYMFLTNFTETSKSVCQSYCLTDNVITVRQGGRLGNCIWEYIAIMGLGKALDLCPFAPKGILECLSKTFKNLSILAYEDTVLSENCRKIHGGDAEKCESKRLSHHGTVWDRFCYVLKHRKYISNNIVKKTITEIQELKKSGLIPSILILSNWWDLPHVLDPIGVQRFKQELQFQDEIKQLAESTFKGVKTKAGNGELIYVGMHVRRTDYNRHLRILHGDNVTFADADYYRRAMGRMHDLNNGKKMVFVVVSDDYIWCMDNLVNETEGVFWGGLEYSDFIDNWEEKRELAVSHDLAILSTSNHTIIGYGTFAITGSLLSGGHTIVCNISRNQEIKNSFASIMAKKYKWEEL